MTESITIRGVRKSDFPSIEILLKELMDLIEDKTDFNIEQSVNNCRELLNASNQYMLVAELDKKVVGFLNFTTRKTIMHAHSSGLIDELVVAKSTRGSGIGKLLVRAAIEKCQKLACSEVEVSTEKNNIKARSFYRSCGFEEDAVLLEFDLQQ